MKREAFLIEVQFNVSRRSMPILAKIQIGDIRIVTELIVIAVTVEHHDTVSILFDGTGVTQVG